MDLTREKIMDVLINVIQEIQEDIIEEPEQITVETVPVGDLCEFDSLASVNATVTVLSTLGFEFDEFPSYPSLFIEKQKALTLGQVADRIIKLKSKRK